MIRVHVQLRDGEWSLLVRGHADYAREDIVCAGVSAVVYALLGALENADEHISTFDYTADSGDVSVFCTGDETIGELFKMAIIGLLQIEKAYPAHVSVCDSGADR